MSVKNNSNTFITLFLVILLIPFLSIAGIKNTMDTTLYQAWQVVAVVFLFVLVYLLSSEIKINWATVLFTLYQSVIFLSCLFHHGFSLGIFVGTVAMVLLFMLMQTPCYLEVIGAICIIVVISVIINLPIMISKLNEEGALYFIGGKNALSMFLVPGAFLFLIHSLEKERKIRVECIVVLALCLFSVLIGDSGTGIVVVFFSFLFAIMIMKFNIKKWICVLSILLFYVLLLLFSNAFLNTELWSYFTGILGKDSSLTSRVALWDAVKDIISDNWLFGSGRGTEIPYINQWRENRLSHEAHNFILEILMEGGVVALAIYGALLYKIIDKLDMKDVRNEIVFISICALLINGLTEATVNSFFVSILLGVASHYAIENRGKTVSNG